jgi:hypothetical protein
MHLAFAPTVSRFLHTLSDIELEADQSLSYPAWLERVQ